MKNSLIIVILFLFINAPAMQRKHWPPLHYAVIHTRVEQVRELLANSANPNEATNQGRTPMHYAVTADKHEFEKAKNILAILKIHGGNINLADNHGFTPRHQAAAQEWPEMMAYLLMLGADRTLKDSDGYTADELYAITQSPELSDAYCRKKQPVLIAEKRASQ